MLWTRDQIAARTALALCLLPMLNGCAVAVLPAIVAGGVLGKGQIDKGKVEEPPTPLVTEPATTVPAAAVVAAPAPHGTSSALIAPVPAAVTEPAPALVEIAEAYKPLIAFVDAQIERQRAAILTESVVPEAGVSLTDPRYVPCSGQPNAVMIDLDRKGGLLAEDGLAADTGLLPALAVLRAKQIRIIWISGERQAELSSLRGRLEKAGLVPEGEDEILFPISARSRKQTLRLEAASRHCVLAMSGDERADFDELFDYLIDPGSAILLERQFGAGWFMTPTPLQPAAPQKTEGNQE